MVQGRGWICIALLSLLLAPGPRLVRRTALCVLRCLPASASDGHGRGALSDIPDDPLYISIVPLRHGPPRPRSAGPMQPYRRGER